MARDYKEDVIVPAGRARLPAILYLPAEAAGVVAFAHGSGSGRLSPRNQYVAGVLQERGIAALLADLLEEPESADRRKVFDIHLLTERLLACARWLRQQPRTRELQLGYFGASTGAAAALQAGGREPESVSAIVSRGGRPDLAMDYLHLVRAPTLLIVGGEDHPVVHLNRIAFERLKSLKDLVIVPGASHLFEEPGALEKVAQLAGDWFIKHFTAGSVTAFNS